MNGPPQCGGPGWTWVITHRHKPGGSVCGCRPQEDGTLESILEDRTALTYMLRPINGQPPLEKEDT